MSKLGLHDPFGHLKHKFWPKEGPEVKLPIWLSTTKSHKIARISLRATGVQHTIGELLRKATTLL